MVFDEIKEIIGNELNISTEELCLNTSFKNDLDADSLDVFQITMAIEEIYNLELSNDEIEDIATIQDLVEFVKKTNSLD